LPIEAKGAEPVRNPRYGVPFQLLHKKMPYVVTEPCIGVKDKSCMTVCPVDCIYEGDEQVFINPDECIDCGLCEPECPVNAIFVDSDVPPNWKAFIEQNAEEGRKLAEG
jgi:ferredoxin